MTEQGALQSTSSQFWVPQGKHCLCFSLNSNKKPRVFKDVILPLVIQVNVLFSCCYHDGPAVSGILVLHLYISNYMSQKNDPRLVFCSKSKSQVHFHICDQTHVSNFLSGSLHGTMSHSMEQGQRNPATSPCWRRFPPGHIQFLLWQTYTLSPDS